MSRDETLDWETGRRTGVSIYGGSPNFKGAYLTGFWSGRVRGAGYRSTKALSSLHTATRRWGSETCGLDT